MANRIRGRKLQGIRQRYLSKHPLCARCLLNGFVSAAVEIDHVVPLHKGGTNEESNYAGLCKACHLEKTREDMGYPKVNGCDVTGDPGSSWV